MRKRLLVAAMLLLLVAPTYATSQQAGPEKQAEAYFRLLQKKDWNGIAAMFDREALSEMRGMLAFMTKLPVDVSARVLPAFFGPGATVASVEMMTDVAFFENFLRTLMTQLEKKRGLDFRRIDVLGSVPEAPDRRHVLARVSMDVSGTTMASMEVLSFRGHGGTWKLLLQEKMKGAARQLKRSLTQAPAK